MTINFTTYFEKFPSSIYQKSTGTNLYKLWKLLSESVNELETAVLDWYEKELQIGIQLDKIGLLKGIPRNSLNDADYRYELNLPRTTEIVTLPAIYQVLSQYSSNFRVIELHSPYQYDYARMDASDFLDGVGIFNPEVEITTLDFLDGEGFLDGLDILEPHRIRRLALLIDIAITDISKIGKMKSEISNLIAGITVYYLVKLEFLTGLTESQYSTNLNGEGFLDGVGVLNPEVKLLLYSGSTLTHEIPIGYGWSLTIPQSSGVITLIEIQNGGELLFSTQTEILTTTFIQFTIKEA